MNEIRTKPIDGSPRRLTIDITPEQYKALNIIFDYGERKIYFDAVINATINIFNKVGKMGIYALISGNVDVIKSLANNKEVK